mmetsp:Transcript_32101/g.73908  ORF Transcript_32101/g.73908 Transcript_32101/m.73908 type:complete len:619 (+) Transcript_32101:30-1886(+)
MGLCRAFGSSHLSLRRASFITSVLSLICLSCVVLWQSRWQNRFENYGASRHLQDLYPDDLVLTKPYGEDENRWLVFLHVIGISYMLLGLNTVCDVYFTGALEVMVERWQIKPDVAGATFMAAGGSAPELFTSLVGATIANNDVGFGTIIGSAVFNVLFVIGLCGYVAKDPIQLTWWPLFRDCAFYIFGLSLLAGFASDELISLAEAIVLFVAYLLYCIIMYFNNRLEALVDADGTRANARKQAQQANASPDSERPPVVIGNWAGSAPTGVVPEMKPPAPEREEPQPPGSVGVETLLRSSEDEVSAGLLASQPLPHREIPSACQSLNVERVRRDPAMRTEDHVPDIVSSQPLPARSLKVKLSARTARAAALQEAARDRHEERMHSSGRPSEDEEQRSRQPSQQSEQPSPEEKPGEEEDEPGLMDFPDTLKDKVIWILSLPVIAPIYFLTPQPSERWFLVCFIFSLVWIALLSFLLVWWVEILGQALHIDPILMSFTLLAAGTSIPDAASSVAVAKQGEGDMAVSSSVGSNIFDILVGLPIPWIIKIALNDVSYQVTIKSPFLAFDVILLLFMVVAVILSIHCLGWKLNRPLGLVMAILYLAFLGIAVSVETAQPEWLKF